MLMIFVLIEPKSVWGFPKQGFAHQQEQTTCQGRENTTVVAAPRDEEGWRENKGLLGRLSAPQDPPHQGWALLQHDTPGAARARSALSRVYRPIKRVMAVTHVPREVTHSRYTPLQCSARASTKRLCDTVLAFLSNRFFGSRLEIMSRVFITMLVTAGMAMFLANASFAQAPHKHHAKAHHHARHHARHHHTRH